MASFIVCYDIQPRCAGDFVRNCNALVTSSGTDPAARYELLMGQLRSDCAQHLGLSLTTFDTRYYISLRSVCRWDLENCNEQADSGGTAS